MVIVYVGGFARDVTEESLRELFGRRVQLRSVEINRKHTKVFSDLKEVPAFAFLNCVCDEDQLAKVLAYNRCYWGGGYLRVQLARKGPYVYTPKVSGEKYQTGACEPSEQCAECNPCRPSKEDNAEPKAQPGGTLEFAEDDKPAGARRKRVRVFNTLRPSACS